MQARRTDHLHHRTTRSITSLATETPHLQDQSSPTNLNCNLHPSSGGLSLAGHRDDAISTLLTADSLFPDEIRCRPIATDLIDGLRRSASGTRSRELEQLAARAGLTNHG